MGLGWGPADGVRTAEYTAWSIYSHQVLMTTILNSRCGSGKGANTTQWCNAHAQGPKNITRIANLMHYSLLSTILEIYTYQLVSSCYFMHLLRCEWLHADMSQQLLIAWIIYACSSYTKLFDLVTAKFWLPSINFKLLSVAWRFAITALMHFPSDLAYCSPSPIYTVPMIGSVPSGPI